MPSWRLEPSAVKVARWVLRETALGNSVVHPTEMGSVARQGTKVTL
ncbi:hypothetical protein GLP14_09035 [Photobacterium carnosum]|nr:hypothetical protein [Photobacterium carnosum]